uniref:Carbamoyl phosphate synthase small chain n=1 Tax=uncultured bacterium Contig29 TaxID=1393550 RepID=W0FI32_9BACT|nr:carbamoyl-phosphate synthase small chain [uncultured bacterium Contig29]
MDKVYLVLEDGTVFPGQPIGADADAAGELVFTTGMCGYLETLTDPSYAGQIIMQTFPLIGNYGVIPSDFEGKCHARGYVVREDCSHPSNFRSEGVLSEYLKSQGIPGIRGVDTRAVTRRIRESGVMNAIICREVPESLDEIRSYRVSGVVPEVTSEFKVIYPSRSDRKYSVVLMDYGAKHNIVRELQARGCEVTVLPADTSAEQVLSMRPDGIMLSNGPGDPAENTGCIEEIRKLLGRVPLFGICLGHQLAALAAGGKTEKMKFGHRGANQPVRDLVTGRTWITSQNHGYAVSSDSLPEGTLRFVNANDGSCEGIDYPDLKAFTVQFHPEASSGPHDTAFLFDRFCSLMSENQNRSETSGLSLGGDIHA